MPENRMLCRSRSAAVLLISLAAVAACAPIAQAPAPAGSLRADSLALARDIGYLASDLLEGRLTGTPGNDSAAAYISRRYAQLRLTAPYPGFLQRFDARSAQDAHRGFTGPRSTQNVVALLPGRDPILRDEYVVIGAHFDHLGRSPDFAMDADAKDAIRNGADDNASGTAVVLELARLLKANPPRRSILFVNFSGEELGLLGSQWFVENSPVPLDRVVAMLNFDMVGRLRDDRLIVYGVETASEMRALVDSANTTLKDGPLKLLAVGDGFGPSDHSTFYGKDLPVLHFFTDLHDDYHRATDDAAKINLGGSARVVDLALGVTRSIGDRQPRLSFTRAPAAPQRASSRAGSDVYLGSIPDMASGDARGLRLTGVRAGSPADKGGLQAGDIVVQLGGREVTDLYSYTDALYAHQPGDTVRIVVRRGAERVELNVTLGRRGS